MPGGQDAHAQAAAKLAGRPIATPVTSPEKSTDPKKVAAGAGYKSKEETRKKVQDVLLQKIRSGGLSKDEDLQKYLADEQTLRQDGDFAEDEDLKLATIALRGVPMDVWKQIR